MRSDTISRSSRADTSGSSAAQHGGGRPGPAGCRCVRFKALALQPLTSAATSQARVLTSLQPFGRGAGTDDLGRTCGSLTGARIRGRNRFAQAAAVRQKQLRRAALPDGVLEHGSDPTLKGEKAGSGAKIRGIELPDRVGNRHVSALGPGTCWLRLVRSLPPEPLGPNTGHEAFDCLSQRVVEPPIPRAPLFRA